MKTLTAIIMIVTTLQAPAPILGQCDYMGNPMGVVDGLTRCQHKFNKDVYWWVKL